jgi:hypothetical protein
MPDFTVLYDEPQEAHWFRQLHPKLHGATEEPITQARHLPALSRVLAYDRPDIILLDKGLPILVVEETVEVPSGHNVGQRFARIAAAAECGVPSLYFGPYKARKHGGNTAGPRYMNVRLFHAFDAMVRATGSAVTSINWPVDADCEVRRDRGKDADVRAYMNTFMESYESDADLVSLNQTILNSSIHCRMIEERNGFVTTAIRNATQYDVPPDSVEFVSPSSLRGRFGEEIGGLRPITREVVLYRVGMTNIRSDPYTGMAMLYHYLYVVEDAGRSLVLWFPEISVSAWRTAAKNSNRKDIRMFRTAADAIAFSDGFLTKSKL